MNAARTDSPAPFSAVVLAGERPGGSAFSRGLGLSAGVLAPVDGKPALRRVIEALGLRKHQMTVVNNDTPAIRGMLHKVRHLVRVK